MKHLRFAWKTPAYGSSTDRVSQNGRQRLTIFFGFAAHVCILIIYESSSFLIQYCSWYRQDYLEVNPLISTRKLIIEQFLRSATIIENVARHCETNRSSAYAYFFFNGKDGQKVSQTVESLIRSLIRQFSTAYGGVPAVLANRFHSCHDGDSQPSVKSLQATLLLILEVFDDVYIILDALDECAERKAVLKWIKQMKTSRQKSKLHLLATSGLEENIAKHLRSLDQDHVYLKQDLVSRDIERYIDSILYGEDYFEQWGDGMKANIKNALLLSAEGMYVVFQYTK
jgi:hypothetical protein